MTRYDELTVSLDGVRPRIWRRFLLAADATFADLHQAIQAACGWWDYHLYEFSDGDGEPLAGIPQDEWDHPVPDAATTPLASHFDRHDRCSYVYDFGDAWEHTVVLDRVVDLDEDFHRRLLDGARAFPHEDCGGIPGYEECVAVARGDYDDEDLRTWLGDWHPDRFDLEAVKAAFDQGQLPDLRLDVGPEPARPAFPRRVALPPPEELAAAAEANPMLERLAAFTRWAGEGRKLTAKGNLTLADGKELVELLGTDDRVDERIGDRTFKTKSTVKLRGVDYAFRLARSAGFVKVQKGALSATRRGAVLGKDSLADWHAAFKGLLDLGVLTHHYAHATWIDPYWKELVDEQVGPLLVMLLADGEPALLEDLHAQLWDLVDSEFVLDDLDEDTVARHRDHLEHDVRRICETFADLGAIAIDGVEVVTSQWGTQHKRGGQVALTGLGAAGACELAAAEGLDVPLAGASRDADVAGLLVAVSRLDDGDAEAETRLWLAAAGDVAEQVAALDGLRAEGAAAVGVLEQIADAHPDKAVAKAARKTLFKLRSAGVA